MPENHAKYAPSSMYLTVGCPGWQRQPRIPEQETDASREGTLAHAVAAAAASVRQVPRDTRPEVTDEMLDGAAIWVEALEGYPATIEQRLPITAVHPTLCWGTPDARQWNPAIKLHRSADYKFGHGFVDEFENWQGLSYTVGSLDQVYPAWRDDPSVKAEITVVQPRFYNAEPIRTWTIQTAGLLHYEARMRNAVQEAESEKPRVMSGPHCVYCPARPHCKVFARSVMQAVDFIGQPDPMVQEPDAVGRELALVQEFIKRLEARETGLKAVAESLIAAGKRVTGYSFEQAVGRLAWTVPMGVVQMLGGDAVMKPPALITPTQAKKILGEGTIKEIAARPAAGMKLVRDTGKIARKFA